MFGKITCLLIGTKCFHRLDSRLINEFDNNEKVEEVEILPI